MNVSKRRGRPPGSKNKKKSVKITKRTQKKSVSAPVQVEPIVTSIIDENDSIVVTTKGPYTYRPVNFSVVKDRKNGLMITSKPIEWESLKEFELDSQWTNCLNEIWFAEKEGRIDRSLLEPFLIAYAKKTFNSNELKNISLNKAVSTAPISILSGAFLFMNGAVAPKYENRLPEYLKSFVRIVEQDQENKNPVSLVKDRTESLSEKIGAMIEKFEQLEKTNTYPDVHKWLVDAGIPKTMISDLRKYVEGRIADLMLYFNHDKQALEYFSRWNKKTLTKIRDWLKSALDAMDSYELVKRATKAVRVRKPKSPAKIVSKLKYLHSDPTLKINSIKPEQIVGASALWVYDTKKRKLYAYHASESDQQLSVKGTYIIGWDTGKSNGKTIRKPDVQIRDFMNLGKVAAKKYLDSIKAVDAKLTGKINKDMVLLRIG